MGLAEGCSRRRFASAVILCLLTCFVFTTITPKLQPQAQAQDNKPDEGAGDAEKAKPKQKGLLGHIFESLFNSVVGVVISIVLFGISISLVALLVYLAMDLRMGAAIPPGFVEEFTDTVNKRKFKEAFDMSRNDNSFLARVMTAGMGRLQYGIDDSREAALNMTEAIKASKDQYISYLATIGTLGPLIGLVGTVFGMIQSFIVLGGGGQPNAAELAKGISHALVVTLMGVSLAVPAIFAHAFFRSRLTRVSLDTSNIADDLLTQMYHNSKRPAPAGAPGSNASASSAMLKPT